MKGCLVTLLMACALGGRDAETTEPAPREQTRSVTEAEYSAALHSPTGVVPAAAQRAGNPQAGWQALISADYVSCGLPLVAFKQLASANGMVAKNRLQRTGPAAELPYSLNYVVPWFILVWRVGTWAGQRVS